MDYAKEIANRLRNCDSLALVRLLEEAADLIEKQAAELQKSKPKARDEFCCSAQPKARDEFCCGAPPLPESEVAWRYAMVLERFVGSDKDGRAALDALYRLASPPASQPQPAVELPEPAFKASPIYYPTSPLTTADPGPMYPGLYTADQVRAIIDVGRALTDAARNVLAERRRQVEVEGWTPEHDDKHNDNAMSVAAACYALANIAPALSVQTVNVRGLWSWTGWANSWFKPKDKRRNLIRAAALLLAEIERLDRAIDASRAGGGND